MYDQIAFFTTHTQLLLHLMGFSFIV